MSDAPSAPPAPPAHPFAVGDEAYIIGPYERVGHAGAIWHVRILLLPAGMGRTLYPWKVRVLGGGGGFHTTTASAVYATPEEATIAFLSAQWRRADEALSDARETLRDARGRMHEATVALRLATEAHARTTGKATAP